ncbi:MAG: SDR family NAD(P)-dependent oxidoreductase, partial [Saprospiraceae bacterium]
MDINLKGKNVLVCGGSGGIGKASAIVLAEMGANVTLLARNEDNLFETLQQLDHSEGQKHDMIVADTSQEEDFKGSLVVLTNKRPIHILVNNSGGPPAGNIVDANTDGFKAAFNQHLIANHLAVQTLLPGMKKEGYGRIINIISTSVKQPLRGLGVSNTIRAAVANWSKTLATELAPHGITVNNVLPGATDTDRLNSIIS